MYSWSLDSLACSKCVWSTHQTSSYYLLLREYNMECWAVWWWRSGDGAYLCLSVFAFLCTTCWHTGGKKWVAFVLLLVAYDLFTAAVNVYHTSLQQQAFQLKKMNSNGLQKLQWSNFSVDFVIVWCCSVALFLMWAGL